MQARAFALESISSAQEESGSFSPQDYRVLAAAEKSLGRKQISDLILKGALLLEKKS